MLGSILRILALAVSHRVGQGLCIWKASSRVKHKERSKEEIICTQQPGGGLKEDQKAYELLGTGCLRDKMSACGCFLSITLRPYLKNVTSFGKDRVKIHIKTPAILNPSITGLPPVHQEWYFPAFFFFNMYCK
jgi:hypothetical protein